MDRRDDIEQVIRDAEWLVEQGWKHPNTSLLPFAKAQTIVLVAMLREMSAIRSLLEKERGPNA